MKKSTIQNLKQFDETGVDLVTLKLLYPKKIFTQLLCIKNHLVTGHF